MGRPSHFKVGLPYILTSYENRAFQKRFQEFENVTLALLFEQKKKIEKKKVFKNHEVTVTMIFLCSSFSQEQI